MRRSRLVTLIASLTVSVTASVAIAVPAHAAGARYVALGDSYASGVGAGSYTAESGSCNRSTNAYPAVWAATNAPASYVSVACSGATTTSVLNSQLSALSSTTTLVSVTVGGNDVGFSSIMTTCVLYGTTDCVAAVQAAENKAQTELPAQARQPVQRHPVARAQRPGRRRRLPGLLPARHAFCVGLSETSRAKINEGINVLDDVIRTAAARHGFVFADVRSIFVGHQLCSGDKWLHALNFANLGISYHPIATGQTGGYYPVFRAAAG